MKSALIVAGVVLVASACRSAGETPQRAAINLKDPCRLLSREQVEDALEVDVRAERLGESRPGPAGVVPLCLYEIGPPFSTLTLHLERPVTATQFTRKIERDPRNTEMIEGIGEGAFIHAGVSILVFQDETLAGASVQYFEDIDATHDALVRLGRVLEKELSR